MSGSNCLGLGEVLNSSFPQPVCLVSLPSPNATLLERVASCCGSAPLQFAGSNTSVTVPSNESCITYCAYEPWGNATDTMTKAKAGEDWFACVQGQGRLSVGCTNGARGASNSSSITGNSTGSSGSGGTNGAQVNFKSSLTLPGLLAMASLGVFLLQTA